MKIRRKIAAVITIAMLGAMSIVPATAEETPLWQSKYNDTWTLDVQMTRVDEETIDVTQKLTRQKDVVPNQIDIISIVDLSGSMNTGLGYVNNDLPVAVMHTALDSLTKTVETETAAPGRATFRYAFCAGRKDEMLESAALENADHGFVEDPTEFLKILEQHELKNSPAIYTLLEKALQSEENYASAPRGENTKRIVLVFTGSEADNNKMLRPNEKNMLDWGYNLVNKAGIRENVDDLYVYSMPTEIIRAC